MSDFDDMLSALRDMRKEPVDPQKHLAHLLEIQNKVKYANFQKYSSETISSIFDDFWLFLMHSSSNSSNPSIRIAAIRVAAYFILNLGPFYPKEINSTFSTVATISTIDMEASSLIASVFGIISYRISTPYRERFLHSCPIFHHITESKSTQEHFISSLSHYTHLGLEFHRLIIKSFMLKVTSDPNDKLYWHGVIEIVTNNPKELFLEVYNSICENDCYQEHIQFMSCLLTIPDAPISNINLFDIAKYALQLLSDCSNNKCNLTCNQKCAVCTILSLKTNSFYVDCSIESEDCLKISLTDAIQSNKSESKVKISSLDDSPEFYLLKLPAELAFPNGEEGSTLLASKLTLLITYLDSNDKDLVDRILDIIRNYMSKPYDTSVSACYQGISNSISKVKNRDVLFEIAKILHPTFYCSSISWFHDMDRLKVIEAFPLDVGVHALGNKSIFPSFDNILNWAKEKNEKLAKYAQHVLIYSYIMQSDAEVLLSRIIKKCDIFNSFDLVRTLEILNQYLDKHQKYCMPRFLIDFCKVLLQLFTIYPDNPDLYIQIVTFITHFHVKKIRTRTLQICLAVILSTYNMITGMNATMRDIDESLLEEENKMIETVASKQSMDIIKDNMNDYSTYIPHLYVTLKFLISIQKLDFKYIQPIIQYTINFFPYEASLLMSKYWKYFPQMSRTSLIGSNVECIKNACGFNCAGIWFEMYMKASELVSDSHYSSSVNSSPFVYSAYSGKEATFSSLSSKIEFTDAYEKLKEFLDLSLKFMGGIDDKALLYYIHFYKFVYPTKHFDFNLIPESKRARVITLINRVPSKSRKKRGKNYSSANFGTNKMQASLTPSSSAPTYGNLKGSSSMYSHMTLPFLPTTTPNVADYLSDTDAEGDQHIEHESSPIADDNDNDEIEQNIDDQSQLDSNLIPSSDHSEHKSENQSDHVTDNSDSDSESESESTSIALPSTIRKSGSDSLSGSSSPINSESGSNSGLLTPQTLSPPDLSPCVSSDFISSNNSRSSFLSGGFESHADSANISGSSSYNLLIQLEDNEVDQEDAPVGIYVPIEFPFEPPKVTNMEQLSEKLSIDDPLIEVQLKHGTYDFDDDELNELYEHYSKEAEKNKSILDMIIQFAKKNEIEINALKGEEEKEEEISKDAALRMIASFKETQKIKKKVLYQLCHELNDSSKIHMVERRRRPRKSSDLEKKEDSEDKDESIQFEVIKRLLNSINDSLKENKLRLLLVTLGNVICTYTRIPFETAKLIITNFNDNFDKLPTIELYQCIENFCQRVCKKGRPARFLTRVQGIMSILNFGGSNIANSLALCRNIQGKEAAYIAQKFLNNFILPSVFRETVILMTILAKDLNIVATELFNSNIQAFLNAYKTFKRNEPIHRQIGLFFNSIFKEKFYDYINKGSNISITTFQFPSNSLFSSYSICIPRFVKYVLVNQKTDYEFKDSKLISFCKEYFELLNIEIQLVEDKKSFVLKKIDYFIEAIQKGKVSIHKIDQYILSWFIFLNQYFKFESILNRLMPVAKIRFNGLFLGVVKFIKFHKNELTPDEIAHITEWKTKTFSKAFKFAMTSDKVLIQAAIQLSQYQEDCEESLDLIRRCQRHYNKVMGTDDDDDEDQESNETTDETNEDDD